MNTFTLLKTSRQNALDLIQNLSDIQLNLIPEGFSNNMIWNLGHLVVTQQLLCYKLSNLDCHVTDEMIGKYRKGTKPEQDASPEEIALIKKLALELVDTTEKEYKDKIFKEYNPYMTSYNVELTSIEDALNFNNIHEGLHYGYMRALYKLM